MHGYEIVLVVLALVCLAFAVRTSDRPIVGRDEEEIHND
jgi:hypothetical protein